MDVKEIKEFMEFPVKIAELTHSPVQVPLDVFKEIMQKLENREETEDVGLSDRTADNGA